MKLRIAQIRSVNWRENQQPQQKDWLTLILSSCFILYMNYLIPSSQQSTEVNYITGESLLPMMEHWKGTLHSTFCKYIIALLIVFCLHLLLQLLGVQPSLLPLWELNLQTEHLSHGGLPCRGLPLSLNHRV